MSISKVLFSFSGRIPRQTYWLAILGLGAVYLLSSSIAALAGSAHDVGHRSSAPSVLPVLLMLLFLIVQLCWVWCILAVTVKRWHDRGKSGFWMLIGVVPIVGPLWSLIELGFLEGTPGRNEFDEGIFSKDVSLDADDPLLSTPPIAGRQCAHCQQQIVSFIGAALCPECKEPLHDGCCREHVAGVHRVPVCAAYPG